MTTFELLKKVCESYGPSGREAEVSKTIEKLVKPLGYKCTTDALGNLICHKEGKGTRLMFAAHMDSLGLIATYFEDGGQIRFGAVGGLYPYRLLAAPVRFANGVKGVVHFGMGLTLREGDREYFFAALDRHFPGLKERYIERYGLAYELPSPNNAALCRLIRETCAARGILEGPEACFAYLREFPEKYEQTSLFG